MQKELIFLINRQDSDYRVDKKLDPPPLFDSFPTSMRTRIDPKTNVVLPKIDAVKDVKRWCEENAK